MRTQDQNQSANSKSVAPGMIARLLTQSSESLDHKTVTSLREAREAALRRHSVRQPVLALDTGHLAHWFIPHSTHQWVAAVVLLLVIVAGATSYWDHSREYEMSHLDLAILTDDLPIEVFVDN
jgi:hypothetical protein